MVSRFRKRELALGHHCNQIRSCQGLLELYGRGTACHKKDFLVQAERWSKSPPLMTGRKFEIHAVTTIHCTDKMDTLEGHVSVAICTSQSFYQR